MHVTPLFLNIYSLFFQATLDKITILDNEISSAIEKISDNFVVGHSILQQMEEKALKALKDRGIQMILQTTNLRKKLRSSSDQLQVWIVVKS